jgi:DNA mismatch endonuclease, patch repair protein
MQRRIELENAVAPATTKRMSRTVGRDNKRERAVRSALHAKGLRFRLHRGVILGTRRTVDIIFPSAAVAVFIDGCFWHGCPKHGTWPKNNASWWRAKIRANVARDRDTDRRLRSCGWAVVRVWEHEAVELAATRIETIVKVRRTKRAECQISDK